MESYENLEKSLLQAKQTREKDASLLADLERKVQEAKNRFAAQREKVRKDEEKIRELTDRKAITVVRTYHMTAEQLLAFVQQSQPDAVLLSEGEE